MILGHLIERNALCYPRHPAVVFEGKTLTFAQLASNVRRLANALAARGVKRKDRVAILAQNCPQYLEIQGVAETTGIISVGVNYRLSAPEQAAIIGNAEPVALFFEAQYAGRVEELRAWLDPGIHLICIGDAPRGCESYARLLAEGSDAPPRSRAVDDDTAYLIYTSGTTGTPKGVMLGHDGTVEMARWIASASGVSQTDRMLIVMPLYHIGAKIEQLAYTLLGATIVLQRAFEAETILASIATERVTATHLAPVMVQMMLDVPDLQRYDVSSVKTITYASAPMAVALLRRAIGTFGPIFMQVYGMTEQCLATVLYKHQHLLDGTPQDIRRLASAGQPFVGADIRIVRGDGSACAIGEIGEIWTRSKGLMQGYWRNPDGTREAIVDGWMKTGDMGHVDDEGFLAIADRKKDMIISGGENIYPREVEEALLHHPAVREAAVIGVPDAKWGESVMAFVALRPQCAATPADLIEHCRTLIASYKKPRVVQLVDALPRLSSTNKIDKKKLREPYWTGRDRQVS
ncbi:MAG: long-chain-fatty-acid--CoA ligase [Casimicrobiaceae bacterium]